MWTSLQQFQSQNGCGLQSAEFDSHRQNCWLSQAFVQQSIGLDPEMKHRWRRRERITQQLQLERLVQQRLVPIARTYVPVDRAHRAYLRTC